MFSYRNNMIITRICKYLSFGSVAVLAFYMAIASVLEKFYGTDAVMKWGYHSAVFIVLWAVAAISGLAYLFMRLCRASGPDGTIRRKFTLHAPATVLLHVSFVLILAGALVTHVFGEQGAIHLRTGDAPAGSFIREDGSESALPFTVELSDFEVEYYAGSYAPKDYRSTLRISSEDSAPFTGQVSMNKILRYGGYRFYQSSYDDDGRGSTLAVSHDPAGVAVTYAGYALLLLSMIFFFFQRGSHFRSVLGRVARSAAATAAFFFCLSSADASAAGAASSLKYLPEETASAYGKMYVYYNDRVCPMQTLARDFTMKLYGKSSYKGLSCEQVLTGWIFYPDSWQETVTMAGESASPKAVMKSRDMEQTIRLVCSGSLLKIFPFAKDGQVNWYSSVDNLPADMAPDQWLFVRRVMSLAGEQLMKKDYAGVEEIFSKILEYQKKTADGMLPPESLSKAEHIYNSIDRPKTASMICLTLGVILFIFSCLGMPSGPRSRAVSFTLPSIASVIVFLYLTAVLVLRWAVSGHVPMSNGFETMMLMGWLSMLLSVSLCRRFTLILPLGFLLCGFSLLVASLGESDPQITHLMPVLSSPLLSMHVASMMLSYTLLGLVMLNSLMAVVRHGLHGKASAEETLAKSRDLSLLILYPAVFLLALGTFLGAVWANVSWGRYWAWDPKEVWALITMLVYAFALHGSSLKIFRRPLFFHWFCVLAFLCVLVTYFGVNFFLGGLHSYA